MWLFMNLPETDFQPATLWTDNRSHLKFRLLYLLAYLRTCFIEHSPTREANRFSASQEIPPHFMEPEGSLPHSQVPATCPYPEPARSSLYP